MTILLTLLEFPRTRGDEPVYSADLFRLAYEFPAHAGMNR